NASNVNLTSGGDIRIVTAADPMFGAGVFGSGGTTVFFNGLLSALRTRSTQSIIQYPGALLVPNNLTLVAREIYPSTDAAFALMSVGSGTGGGIINTVPVASNGRAPVAPLSADGMILVDAPNIVQSGALIAPLGTIELGLATGQAIPTAFTANGFTLPTAVVTQSLLLNAGTTTSASAAGLMIPYGTTVNRAT